MSHPYTVLINFIHKFTQIKYKHSFFQCLVLNSELHNCPSLIIIILNNKIDFLLFMYFHLWDKVSLCSPGWLWTYYVAQADFKLGILLPGTHLCWNYRHALPHSSFIFCFVDDNYPDWDEMKSQYVLFIFLL
jgi:hypothetical protein